MSRPPYPEHSEPITGPGWQMRDGCVPAGGIGTLAGRAVRVAMVSSRVRCEYLTTCSLEDQTTGRRPWRGGGRASRRRGDAPLPRPGYR